MYSGIRLVAGTKLVKIVNREDALLLDLLGLRCSGN